MVSEATQNSSRDFIVSELKILQVKGKILMGRSRFIQVLLWMELTENQEEKLLQTSKLFSSERFPQEMCFTSRKWYFQNISCPCSIPFQSLIFLYHPLLLPWFCFATGTEINRARRRKNDKVNFYESSHIIPTARAPASPSSEGIIFKEIFG